MYDRQSYVDNLQFGMTTVADTLPSPTDPLYKLVVDRGLPRFPYDLNAAAVLMGQAGWNRGPDGIYRNAAGSSFDIEAITKMNSDESFRLTVASADMLKQAGLNATARSFPNVVSTAEDRKQRSTFKGVFASITVVDEPRAGQAFLTSGIRVDADGNSVGGNTYRYSNPEFDQLFNRYITTLDNNQRPGYRADMLRFLADQVPFVPLFYGFGTVSQAVAKNVSGPGKVSSGQQASGWGIETWGIN
ncbi:MAG: hypothetical protein EXR58_08155 [Chloroflexi bacterium]|nr:hypothetical protein [Chloroflexota bacterium]